MTSQTLLLVSITKMVMREKFIIDIEGDNVEEEILPQFGTLQQILEDHGPDEPALVEAELEANNLQLSM